jgi:hypothetical protein
MIYPEEHIVEVFVGLENIISSIVQLRKMKLTELHHSAGNSNSVRLAIRSLSAWPLGIENIQNWESCSDGTKKFDAKEQKPDLKFVAPMLRRRLSALSRMVFFVATNCLEGQDAAQASVFCTRYGEYDTTFNILMNLANGNEVSPAAFSTSVHNASAGQFSIDRQDRSQVVVLSAGEATLEAAFIEAWGLLNAGDMSQVLLVYHDEVLPSLYNSQETTVGQNAAFALLLSLCSDTKAADCLHLSWQPQVTVPKENTRSADPDIDAALRVLHLARRGGDPVIRDTGRLEWKWSRHATEN